MTSDFARASAFEEEIRERCAERTVPFRWGRAHFTATFDRVWELNALRVDRPGATVDDLVAEAERLQGEAGLVHRRIAVLDEQAGAELEPGFRERGWKVDRFVFMVHRREPERRAGDVRVEEVVRARLEPLRARLIRTEPWGQDDEVARQLLASSARVARAARGRQFAALADGEPASGADLYSDGRTAQIEDVSTLPEYRGRGLATAVVLTALDEALKGGHDFVFLIADDNDWPKDLYTRLGFDTVGCKYSFLRPPAPAGRERTGSEARGA